MLFEKTEDDFVLHYVTDCFCFIKKVQSGAFLSVPK